MLKTLNPKGSIMKTYDFTADNIGDGEDNCFVAVFDSPGRLRMQDGRVIQIKEAGRYRFIGEPESFKADDD
jgi:hypothetical protein